MHEEQYENLATAIVLQAAMDYGYYYKKLSKPDMHTSRDIAASEIRKIECFFRSQRFALMTDLNGRELLEKLQRNPTIACNKWKQRNPAKKG